MPIRHNHGEDGPDEGSLDQASEALAALFVLTVRSRGWEIEERDLDDRFDFHKGRFTQGNRYEQYRTDANARRRTRMCMVRGGHLAVDAAEVDPSSPTKVNKAHMIKAWQFIDDTLQRAAVRLNRNRRSRRPVRELGLVCG